MRAFAGPIMAGDVAPRPGEFFYALEVLSAEPRKSSGPWPLCRRAPTSALFAAAVAVVCDAEAVSLVAQMLYHAQCFRIFVDVERYAIAREVYFFEALGDAHHRLSYRADPCRREPRRRC